MINTKFDINVLTIEANKRGVNVLRYLFDTHIYKHISREKFIKSGRAYNNTIVQIADHGLDHINVRIKTEGVNATVGDPE